MKKGNTFARAVGWSGLGRIGTAMLTVLRLYLLSRLLPPEDFGIIALVQVVLSISQLFLDSGVSVGFLHHQRTDNTTFSTLVWWNVLIASALYGVILMFSPYLAAGYATPELAGVLVWSGLCLPIGALGIQFRIAQQKTLSFGTMARIDWSAAAVNTIGSVFLAWSGWGVYALVAGQLLQVTLSSLAFIRSEQHYKLSRRFRFSLLKPYLRIGLFYTGGQLLNTLTRDLDALLIGAMLGMEDLGVYHLLKKLASRSLQLFNPILSQVFVPILARQQQQPAAIGTTFLAGLRLIAGVQSPLYIGLAFFAAPVLHFFYGDTYVPYAPIFAWLCGYYLARALIRPFSDLVIARGKTDWELYWNIAYATIGAVVIGLGASQSLTALAQYLCIYLVILLPLSYLCFIRPLAGVKARRYAGIVLWPLVSAGLAISAVYFATDPMDAQYSLGQLVLSIIISAGGYWAVRALGEGLQWPATLWRTAQQTTE